jgi:hypothetical protein
MDRVTTESRRSSGAPVFVSYARTDAELALAIGRELRDAGINVWLDTWELRPGESWAATIEKQIRGISAMVVLIGRDSAKSPHLTSELALASIAQRENPSLRIFPVLVREDADVPLLLRDVQYVDASRNPQEAWAELVKALRADPKEAARRQDALEPEALLWESIALQRRALELELDRFSAMERNRAMRLEGAAAKTAGLGIVLAASASAVVSVAATALNGAALISAIGSVAAVAGGTAVWLRVRRGTSHE